jgi:hypothetical protein
VTAGQRRASAEETCPHCQHPWFQHVGYNDRTRCTQCGCMWSKPKPPPVPLTPEELAQQQMLTKIHDAIFVELDRQHEEDEIEGAGYFDDESGCVDGEPNWGKVAASVLALFTPKWSDDLAGPDWARYVRWESETEVHHGPKYLEDTE